MTILGTPGDDRLVGTSGNDAFDLTQGGNDMAAGRDGKDTFNFGSTFTTADRIDGGNGNDTLDLDGGASVAFQPRTLAGVENILVATGYDYSLQLAEGTIAAGKTLSIDANALGTGNSLSVTDGAETDGNLQVTGGAGSDFVGGGLHHTVVDGGDGNDIVQLNGGVNIVQGGAGDDNFHVLAPISASSQFDGGSGSNQIIFDGDFSAGQIMGAGWDTNITDMGFGGGHSYKMTLQDGFVAAGETAYLYGNELLASDTISLNASQLTHGNVYLQGGDGTDKLIGSAGDDGFEGRQGRDVMTGGAGSDTFNFNAAADSTGSTFDRITDFDASNDQFAMGFPVGAIDAAVTGGALSINNIDSKLPVEIGASQLHAGDAVLFTPSSGTLSGHVMLIVDANGMAGYQAGVDFVIDVTGMTGTLDISNF